MNLNQVERKDSQRIKESHIFVIDVFGKMISKPLAPRGPDDGKDYTASYVSRLDSRRGLRFKKRST